MLYYRIFAFLYGAVGSCAKVAMVNSTWTRGHIHRLWWGWKISPTNPGPFRVFPPCNTEDLVSFPIQRSMKNPLIISIGQFRPEKAHEVQLKAFALALKQAQNSDVKTALNSKLVLIGGCRDEGDYERVDALKQLAESLDIAQKVEFRVNLDYGVLRDCLRDAVVGLHTMIDEHFGIGIVEYMAAGVIAVANNSGGPAADIVVPTIGASGQMEPTGYLASSAEEYANAIVNVLTISTKEREKMATAARKSVRRFSEKAFDESFINATSKLLNKIEET